MINVAKSSHQLSSDFSQFQLLQNFYVQKLIPKEWIEISPPFKNWNLKTGRKRISSTIRIKCNFTLSQLYYADADGFVMEGHFAASQLTHLCLASPKWDGHSKISYKFKLLTKYQVFGIILFVIVLATILGCR